MFYIKMKTKTFLVLFFDSENKMMYRIYVRHKTTPKLSCRKTKTKLLFNIS
jgi:hypothetical protein